MVKTLRTSILFIVTLLLAIGCTTNTSLVKPKVQKGQLDLSNYNFATKGTVSLSGEWEFYWKQFYKKKEIGSPAQNVHYTTLPSNWNGYKNQNKQAKGIGYATYRLKIKLPKKNLKLALKIPSIATAFKLYINNRLMASSGKPGVNKSVTYPRYSPQVINFTNAHQTSDIIIQVANYHHYYGGIWQEITLGSEEQIKHKRESKIISNFFLVGSIFIIALYHLGLFWIRKKSISALYFSFVCLLAALRLIVTGEYLINSLVTFHWFTIIRLEYLSVNLTPIAFAWFLYSLFPQEYSKKILAIQSIILGTIGTVTLLFSPLIFTAVLRFTQIFILLSCIYALYILVKAALNHRQGAKLFIAGFLILFISVLNDILHTAAIINTDHHFGAGLFLFILSQAMVISFRFSQAFIQSEELSEKLNYTNKNLEKLVNERTEELQTSNNMLNQFVDELDTINHILSSKNQDITDSIHYASSIQKALLPLDEDITQIIPEYFIFYKPLDIVSGDFYWFTKIPNKQDGTVEKVIFAAVDCTGHGVPGAFMSMLGIESLNNIVNQQKITQPQKILTRLDEHITQTLRQRLNNIRDGMDLALCTIDFKQKTLTFAGARNPLILFSEQQMQILKGSPFSIGGFVQGHDFEEHSLKLSDTNMIYMFTDGFQDQFGSKKKRKFMKKRLYNLLSVIHQKPMAEQHHSLDDTIKNWMEEGKETQIDDMLVVGLKLDF